MGCYRTFLLGAALIGLGATSVRAGNRDPFRDADAIHEIGLARLADEAGDSALKDAMGAEVPRERALLAIRAAPFAGAPELLVSALLAHAVGRDPSLAPEAALALRQIASRLRPSELAAREVLRSDLKAAREALAAARESGRALRPDIADALSELQITLGTLMGSAPLP